MPEDKVKPEQEPNIAELEWTPAKPVDGDEYFAVNKAIEEAINTLSATQKIVSRLRMQALGLTQGVVMITEAYKQERVARLRAELREVETGG